MTTRQWTEQEDIILLDEVRLRGQDWVEIALAMEGRSPDACRHRYGRIAVKEKAKQGTHAPVSHKIFYDENISADWRERLRLAAAVKDIRDRDKPFIPIADVGIETDRPIAILFSSDWQLGSLGVNMELWRNHMDTFLGFDNMYMVVNGDLISNTHIHRTLSAVWSQVMSPDEQMRMVSSLARELVDKGKLVAITLSEEHDQKDERDTGRAGILDMLRDKQVPLFDNRGIIVLRVGDMIYIIYCVHNSRYYSSFNQLHSGAREFQLGIPANIVVTSHKHDPAWGSYPWYSELRMLMDHLDSPIRLGGDVFILQTGTYENESRFGNRFFGLDTPPKLLIAVLHPDKHRITMCEGFDDARKQMA